MTARIEVFLARWILLLVITTPLILLAVIFVSRAFSILMLLVAVVPLIVFFREDLMKFMQDWYSLVRGRKPKRRD